MAEPGGDVLRIRKEGTLPEKFVEQGGTLFGELPHALDFQFVGAGGHIGLVAVLIVFARDNGYGNLSIGSMKMMMHNAFMLDRFISISGKSPKLRKNDTVFKELLFLGLRAAA